MKKILKKEEKELLIKDLLPRIQTNLLVKVPDEDEPKELRKRVRWMIVFGKAKSLEDCLTGLIPYLRPLSDITEEEKKELKELFGEVYDGSDLEIDDSGNILEKNFESSIGGSIYIDLSLSVSWMSWLISHHFDFRGLIDKGLAIKAEKGMYV
jgi:hypothetical protein